MNKMNKIGDAGATESAVPKRRRRVWWWLSVVLLFAAVVVTCVVEWMVHHAEPILKARVIGTLSTRFDSRVEMDGFHVSVAKGLEVSGEGLRIYAPDDVVAAGVTAPLISLGHFAFHAEIRGLFEKPMRVSTVYVDRMTISVPPKEMRKQGLRNERLGKITIVVDEIVCNNSHLIIGTSKPDKAPLEFELGHIVMQNVGPNDPWRYDATLVNAIPRGDIHAAGTFGHWVNESPGDSAVTGKYTFEHADLNTIRGIGGVLSSTGEFSGQLNRIVVDGTTETPEFSLDTANHRMPLHTTFHAIVDGTSGDTYLQPVDAKLGDSEFSCNGAIVNVKGQGHDIDLDVNVPNGRIQDFLELGVRTQPAVMTGRLSMETRLNIRPANERVMQRMVMNGQFTLRAIHFSNPAVQDKVDMLSLRAQGEPKLARPGAEDVRSQMTGQFDMDKGKLKFSQLAYSLPGADVNLTGVYTLDGNQFEFAGKVRTKATLSQMVSTRWKSLLLKPVDPLFKKNGAGAEIPVKISGTKGDVQFGLDLKHKGQKH
ncbi:AsmA family protein [Edaphobacter bradus]|uniref:hypothetical protein n=1 Tax=Edaphobacter bradus TaxID=2259016 RepID=UPI0021DFDAF0|nr:hypothetical protein [Edaphobacter bradus]